MSGIPEVAERPIVKRPRRWQDMSRRQQIQVIVAAIVQIALAVTAWTDLAKRPASRVNGPKAVWGVIIGVNFFGPIAYFIGGRKNN